MKNFTFDIGGSGTKYIIFENKTIINKGIIEYEKKSIEIHQTKMQEVLDKISNLIISTIIKDEKFNLGISIPGIIDTVNYEIIEFGAIDSNGVKLKDYFAKFPNLINFVIENDGNASAIGEYTYGINDKNVKNFIHITIGTSIGMGLIFNQQIYKGKNFKAGELCRGYASIVDNSDSPLAMEVGVGTAVMKYNSTNKNSLLDNGFSLFELAKQNDQLAKKVINELTTGIAKLIINLNYLLDFDLLTIGGGISVNQKFIDEILAKLEKYKTIYYEDFQLTNENIVNLVQGSQLKNDAACYGVLAILNKDFIIN